MKTRNLLTACLAVLSLLGFAPSARAEGPTVTRTETSWSHSFQSSDRGTRVRVQTAGWVWNSSAGAWQWQVVDQQTASQDHQEQEDYSAYTITSTWRGWGR
ncbi:MAG: hypothetical protein QM765_45980 [Myxococcales bacterium]